MFISFFDRVMYQGRILMTLELRKTNQSCAFEYAVSVLKTRELLGSEIVERVYHSNWNLVSNLVPHEIVTSTVGCGRLYHFTTMVCALEW